MKKIFFILFVSILSFFNSYSQDYFEKSYPNERLDWHSHKLLSSEDHGSYILAYSGMFGESFSMKNDLIKLDSAGNQLWHYEVGTGQYGIGYAQSDFSISPDSFVYLACNEIGCSGDGNIYKIDQSGNIVWDREYGLNISVTRSKFYAICSAKNHDQIIGGAITGWNDCIPEGPYIFRMAPNGMTIWEYRWDSLYPGQSINKVEVFHDTTYLLHLNSVTVQINNSGQIISTMFPTGNFKVIDTGGFISIGQHQIIKLSDSLNVLWQSPFYSDRIINDLIIDSTGNYFITGRSDTCSGEMFVSKIDSIGNILFTKLYGGDLKDEGNCIIFSDKEHIVAAGSYQINQWKVFEDHYYDCQKFITYTSQILLVKLRTSPLSLGQCESSSGKYSLCDNDSILLTAPSGFSYLWNTGNTTQSIIIDSTGSYEVIISDTSGNSELLPKFNSYKYPFPQLPHFADSIFTQCSGNFDICLSVPYSDTISDRTFRWFRSGIELSKIPVLWEIHGLHAGTYYNISSNVCGSDTSGNFVLLNIPPIVSLGNDTLVCNPDTVFLDAGTGNYSYTWQDGSNTQTYLAFSNSADTLDYYVQKKDFSGCSSSDTIKIIFEICTGINIINLNSNFLIFPNPSGNILYVTQSNNELLRSIKIFNSIGQKQLADYSLIKNGEYIEVNTTSLSSGFYFLEMITDKQKIVKKFVKE